MDKDFSNLNRKEKINSINRLFQDKYEYSGIDKKIESWFESIKEEDMDVYLNLLYKFKYYCRKNIIEELRKVHKKVLEFDKTIDSTIFFPMISKDFRTNHSYEIHNMYREANSLNKGCFLVDINYALNNVPMDKISNIVFIDDMMGSGQTIKNSMKSIHKKYKKIFEKNIYIVLLEVPENIDTIEQEIESEIGVKIKILYSNKHKKAFTKNYIFDEENLDKAKEIVKKYDKMLTNKDGEVLGFCNSEFLLSFYYDTPNNTILSFWKKNEGINWNPPFSRNTKSNHRPSWINSNTGARQLRSKKNTRKKMNDNLNSNKKRKRR